MASQGPRRRTLLQTAGHAWDILRTEGTRAFWFWLLGCTVFRRLTRFERSLEEAPPEPVAEAPIEIDLLTAAAVAEYVTFRPDTEARDVLRRLDAGHACFTARRQGCLVADGWVAIGEGWTGYLSRQIPLARDEAYVYDVFTSHDHRGQGISSAIEGAIIRHFAAAGYRRLLRLVLPENRAAVRVAEKNGYRRRGIMGYVKIGRWRRDFWREVQQTRPL